MEGSIVEPKRKKTGVIITVIVLVICAVAAIVYFTVIAPGNQRSNADALREEGKLVEAEAIYAKLEQNSEIQSIRRELYYESRVLYCASMLKRSLLNPDSLIIREAGVCKPAWSSSVNNQYCQPDVIIHYTARTSGGSTVSYFVSFDGELDSYTMGTSVTTLDSSNLPSYLDLTEKRDWLTTILSVNLATYDRVMSDDQVATINAILSDNRVVVKSFVNYNDLIPRPTPYKEN